VSLTGLCTTLEKLITLSAAIYTMSSHLLCAAVQGLEEEEEVAKLPPMFITEFVLDTMQLTFMPDEEEFQDKLAEVIKQFQVRSAGKLC
jgi:hypothetical protein